MKQVILVILALLLVGGGLWIFSAPAAVALGSYLLILVILALIWLPKWQAARSDLEKKEQFEAENEARKTLAEFVGGVALLVGLYFTWANLQLTQATTAKTLEIAQETLKNSQAGQLADRFTKAVDQLGAVNDRGEKKLEIRLGGIYALEQIARISEPDHWPIMEILTAYVREHGRWPPKSPKDKPLQQGRPSSMAGLPSSSAGRSAVEWQPSRRLAPDILSVLTVLGRRYHIYEKKNQHLDLSETDLRGAQLTGVHLEKANLGRAQLLEAHLEKANLQGVDLAQADLEGAHLEGANLERADLRAAVLEEVDLKGANLQGARLDLTNFNRAHLEKANLQGVHLVEAGLVGANLEGANLEEADLTAVSMDGADLKYVSLKGAKNLTVKQLATVKTLYQARLDPPLLEQIQQQYPHLLEKPRE
jgi:uncharacterized protein YjbI with pentapeptide repeats